MKWGKRRSRKSVIKKTTSTNEDHEIKSLIKTKKISEMSNQEIKKINERIQLEKQLKDLTKKSVSPGRKFVEEILTNAAKEVASNYVKKQISKVIQN
jgi:hypothetical protein